VVKLGSNLGDKFDGNSAIIGPCYKTASSKCFLTGWSERLDVAFGEDSEEF
jgi:hypothetical protein